VGLDVAEKRKICCPRRKSNPVPSAVQPVAVAIPTELSELLIFYTTIISHQSALLDCAADAVRHIRYENMAICMSCRGYVAWSLELRKRQESRAYCEYAQQYYFGLILCYLRRHLHLNIIIKLY
jgi:hypothetical protein